MALAALLVLQFDLVPSGDGGEWVEPSCENTPAQSGFPVPDVDFAVDLIPRGGERKWRVRFSGSDKVLEAVAEDLLGGSSEWGSRAGG